MATRTISFVFNETSLIEEGFILDGCVEKLHTYKLFHIKEMKMTPK
jgi:hypothetical protein